MQPSIFVDAFLCLRHVVEVAHHDVTTAEADLAFAFLIAASDVVDFDLDARNRSAARTSLEVVALAHVLRAGVFRHAVHFQNVDADHTEVIERVLHDRRRTGEANARLIKTEGRVRLLLHECRREASEERFTYGGADLRRRVRLSALVLHETSDTFLETSHPLGFRLHRFHHLFPHAGHGEEHSRLGLDERILERPLEGIRTSEVHSGGLLEIDDAEERRVDIDNLSRDVG